MGEREAIGDHIAVGYLTTATVIDADRRYYVAARGDRELHVDAEVCVEFGRDVGQDPGPEGIHGAIARCWPALEIVNLAPLANEPESVVADNVFHCAVAFGKKPIPLTCREQVTSYVNGRFGDREPWPADLPDRIASAAAILAALDQRIRAGDRVITGSITQLPFTAGDLLQARFGNHASVTVHTARKATAA
ncbi:MAG: hypothetical protein JO363_22840 [Solirubrobacterales bacterium]|nr:hypothetical protein [Solirubrobacterales bacterium]